MRPNNFNGATHGSQDYLCEFARVTVEMCQFHLAAFPVEVALLTASSLLLQQAETATSCLNGFVRLNEQPPPSCLAKGKEREEALIGRRMPREAYSNAHQARRWYKLPGRGVADQTICCACVSPAMRLQ
ncbi:hypothetical protein UY3_03009 [Chelonia mydas]|uniref:Uncharacterized protein n=1 Tax=Chelonia mydas TaxID=8469 RepID=M7BV90_CHEMY|nr:hypothetical protein UY3_03009 [Chelonia mydas]